MKIVSWNVNGLRSVLEKGFGDYIATEQPDVVCLQEIKVKPEQIDAALMPQGYELFWNPAQRAGYSGTLTMSKVPPLRCAVAEVDAEGDAEGRCQMLEFESFYLVNVYTPNAKGDLSRLAYRTEVWDVRFRELCTGLAQHKPVLFCGDLNVAHQEIDLARPRENQKNAGFTAQEREAFSATLAAGFVDTFRARNPQPNEYSWWSYRSGMRQRNVGWRIDYCCVSTGLMPQVSDAFIRQQVMGSDHCPVGVELSL